MFYNVFDFYVIAGIKGETGTKGQKGESVVISGAGKGEKGESGRDGLNGTPGQPGKIRGFSFVANMGIACPVHNLGANIIKHLTLFLGPPGPPGLSIQGQKGEPGLEARLPHYENNRGK